MPQRPSMFKYKYDKRGHLIEVVPDESMRPLYKAIADALLDGVAWSQIPAVIAKKGFLRDNGKPYVASTLYKHLTNPHFWGHTVYNSPGRADGDATWQWDRSTEPPEHVSISYDTHTPFFTGVFGERLKGELTHRTLNVVGRRAPRSLYLFTGLLVCNVCGYTPASSARVDSAKYRCSTRGRYIKGKAIADCDQTNISIHDDDLKAWMNEHVLTPLYDAVSIDDLFPEKDALDALTSANNSIREQIDSLNASLSALVDVDTSAVGEQIAELMRNLTTLQERYRVRAEAVGRIKRINDFWDRPTHAVNRDMRELLGGYRIAVQDGRVVGLVKTRP